MQKALKSKDVQAAEGYACGGGVVTLDVRVVLWGSTGADA
jgi:hypothetical protein